MLVVLRDVSHHLFLYSLQRNNECSFGRPPRRVSAPRGPEFPKSLRMDCHWCIREPELQLRLEEKQAALFVGIAFGVFLGMSRFDLYMCKAFGLSGAFICFKTRAEHLYARKPSNP